MIAIDALQSANIFAIPIGPAGGVAAVDPNLYNGPNQRMKRRHMRSSTLQTVKHATLIFIAVSVVGLMIYLNMRHVNRLLLMQERKALMQEQIEQDPRFKKVAAGVDSAASVSVLSGSVESEEDLRDLQKIIFKKPPLPGTFGWRVDVEVRK